jgi:hypothetical protein
VAKTPAKPRAKEMPVDLTKVHDPIEFEPRTPLGQVLWEVRRRLIADGVPFLSEEEFERELAERRGGVSYDE